MKVPRRVVVLLCVLFVAGLPVSPAGADTAKPTDRVKPLDATELSIPWSLLPVCDTSTLALGKWVSTQLKVSFYVEDKPVEGEKGYVDQELARLVSKVFTDWAAVNKLPLTTEAQAAKAVATALANAAFQNKLKAEVQAYLARTGGVVPSQQGGGTSNGTLQVWCVEAGNGHGTDFGYVWTPTGGKPLFVGACTIAGGRNVFGYERDLQTRLFTKTIWVNFATPNDTGVRSIDVYTYDVATKTLVKETRYGRWTKGDPWTFTPSQDTSKNTKTVIKDPTILKNLMGASGRCDCTEQSLDDDLTPSVCTAIGEEDFSDFSVQVGGR